MQVHVTSHEFTRQTPFQRIDIVDTESFGKMLLLDGHIQLAELDEFAYHESLVQIPLHAIDAPERALVIGGGDGGVIREICRHESIKHIDMVEIDRGVVDACRDYLPELSGNAFDDPRLNLHIADAFPFVKLASEPYDLIVMDSTDVYEDEEGGLSEQLWTAEFYDDIVRLLSPKGLVVTQADNLLFCPYSIEDVVRTYRKRFERVGTYWGLVPSFGGYSGFVWGSKGAELPKTWPGARVDLRYLNETTYALGQSPLPFG